MKNQRSLWCCKIPEGNFEFVVMVLLVSVSVFLLHRMCIEYNLRDNLSKDLATLNFALPHPKSARFKETS